MLQDNTTEPQMPAAPPVGTGLMAAAAPAPDDLGTAGPDEQGLYNTVVANGMRLIYAPNAFPKVLKLLEGGGDPVEGLSQAATSVMQRLVMSMAQAGTRVPSDVLYKAGIELFEDLAAVSGKADIHDFEADPEALEAAFYRTTHQLGSALAGSGVIAPEQAAAEWGEMEQADQSGDLTHRFRSLMGSGQERAEPQAERGGLMPKGAV